MLAGIALACDDVWSLLLVPGLGLAAGERPTRGGGVSASRRRRKRLVPGVW